MQSKFAEWVKTFLFKNCYGIEAKKMALIDRVSHKECTIRYYLSNKSRTWKIYLRIIQVQKIQDFQKYVRLGMFVCIYSCQKCFIISSRYRRGHRTR